MLAPQLKKKVDALWNKFWTAGIANPLVAVEQITYLLFLKRLEALDNERVSKGKPSIYAGNEQCKWSYIKQDRTPQHLLNKVFPWLRELEKTFAASNGLTNGIEAIGQRMSDAYSNLIPTRVSFWVKPLSSSIVCSSAWTHLVRLPISWAIPFSFFRRKPAKMIATHGRR